MATSSCNSSETSSVAPSFDLLFENHGSLFLIRPVSPGGQSWLDENIGDDAQVFGNAIVCEPRYVEAIFDGAMNDGLVCA